VQLPWLYPTACSGKASNPELNKILNVKWVIVPVGSEHSTFTIHPKNQYEEPLLKS
jgi:histone deacetylase complex regulatory component SIN3